MMHLHPLWILLATLTAALSGPVNSPQPAKPVPPAGKPGFTLPAGGAALVQALRALLPDVFPPTLYEASPGWGKTKTVWTGITLKDKGTHRHPVRKTSVRNHGTWRKIKITANPKAVAFDVRDFQRREAGRITFTLEGNFDARVDYVRQRWANGIKLYDQSIRARLKVGVTLQCEAVGQVRPGTLLPDLVLRLRVLHSDVRYSNVVCEHFAGFGGTPAKMAGDLLLKSVRRFHPALERKLLDRANAAIVKAADTKEVRIEFSKLLGK
jgi:hypothetical protein